MKLIIPMAGKGTRLRPHTLIRPKPLLGVAGKSMLEHILDNLQGLKFSEVIFITGEQKDSVESFVKKRYSFKSTFIEQKVANGSAGAILLTREIVQEDVMIIFSDTLFEADLSVVKKAHEDPVADGIIWIKEVEDFERFGVCVAEEGYVRRIVEKPKEPISKMANIGMYYIKDYALMYKGIDHIFSNKIMLNNEFFFTDAIAYMIDNGARIKTASVKEWYDCGTLATLLDTNRKLLKKHHAVKSRGMNTVIISPVFIDSGVTIRDSVIGPDVSVSSGCSISGSIIRSSIIGQGSQLTDMTIVDSTVGQNASLKGSLKRIHLGDYSEVHYD